MKRVIVVCIGTALLLAVMFAPHLPWSARFHRTLGRLVTKAEIRVARWSGQQPMPVSMTGKVTGYGAQVEALRGARIIAAESTSGYSAMCDGEGRFVLPHLTWYPGASYNLIIAADAYHLKRIKLNAPPLARATASWISGSFDSMMDTKLIGKTCWSALWNMTETTTNTIHGYSRG